MIPVDGPIVAPPDVAAYAWVSALPADTLPLVLAPGSARGWFGGTALVAWSPESVAAGLTLVSAGDALERSRAADRPEITAVLLPYDGDACAARYLGGLVLTAAGWRTWGALNPADVPVRAVGEVRPVLARSQPLAAGVTTDLGAAGFRSRVRRVREAIAAGDVYVLNLTRRLTGSSLVDPPAAFAALVTRTDADMAAFWRTPGVTIASASPERFVRLAGDRAEICPIKGTRPRAVGEADDALAADLAGSAKERAEHVMIVDLERNDLGRVCRPGTVTADPLFEIVRTPYCHQMVSTVSGRLRPDASLSEILHATFPCGSVTGAPKIAAMRVIDSLEASPRGAYTGSLVVAVPGEIDSSVLIRTAEHAGGRVRWGTGGGITADSDPAEEWLETVLKATPFLGDAHPAVALRETMRVTYGRVPLLARHLARLAAGGCGPGVLADVRAAVADATDGAPAGPYGRLSVTVEPGGRVRAELTEAPSSLSVPGGIVPVTVERTAPPVPAGAAKPADRALWDDAQVEAERRGGHQAVLVDAAGTIIDGATASVWVRIGEELLTPPAPPAVDGVARGVVFDVARDLGYRVGERALPATALQAADEVFFTNALAGVAPARGRAGAAFAALEAVFREALGG